MRSFFLVYLIISSIKVLCQEQDDLYYIPSKDTAIKSQEVLVNIPRIENLQKEVTPTKIHLTYDLIGKVEDFYNVRVFYNIEGNGQRVKFAKGDIGNGLAAGINKKIEIDFKKEGIRNSEAYQVIFNIEIHNGRAIEKDDSTMLDDSLTIHLEQLTAQGHKVFVISDDQGVTSHARFKLRDWGFWTIVDDIRDADFILRFSYTNKVVYSTAFAEFIDPKTKLILKKTGHPKGVVVDLNVKRGTINMLINQEIIRHFNKF